MQEVEKLCDRILFINNGCIVADRLVSDLKQESIDLESYFNKLTTKIEEK
jgi:ABC-type multidrug transport system ATPase subunit